MRWVLVLLLATACGGSEQMPPDARTTTPPCPPAPSPQCSSSCGNNKIDTCYRPDTSHDHCFPYYMETEVCDGTATTTSCAEHGYYGGVASCTNCVFSAKDCDLCAANTNVVDCARIETSELLRGFAAATTGGDPLLLVATGTMHTIYSAGAAGLTQVAQRTSVDVVGGLVGVPDGWLAVTQTLSGFTLRHIDAAGVASAALPVGQGPLFAIAMAYGPAGRALIAWSEWDGMASRVWIALTDAAGAVVVSPTEVLAAGTSPELPSVTTDGTSFFLATTRDAQLRQVASNGALVSTTAGFPIGSGVRVQWSGATGWYLTRVGAALAAQRFDAAGGLIGPQLQVMIAAADLLARGDELLVVHRVATPIDIPDRLELQHIDSAGAVSAPLEIGVGVFGPNDPRLTAVGGSVAVTWPHGNRREIALVTP